LGDKEKVKWICFAGKYFSQQVKSLWSKKAGLASRKSQKPKPRMSDAPVSRTKYC